MERSFHFSINQIKIYDELLPTLTFSMKFPIDVNDNLSVILLQFRDILRNNYLSILNKMHDGDCIFKNNMYLKRIHLLKTTPYF